MMDYNNKFNQFVFCISANPFSQTSMKRAMSPLMQNQQTSKSTVYLYCTIKYSIWGCGFMANTVLGFVSCCICHSTSSLDCCFLSYNAYNTALTSTYTVWVLAFHIYPVLRMYIVYVSLCVGGSKGKVGIQI